MADKIMITNILYLIVGGIIAGGIGFFSALGIEKRKEQKEIKNSQNRRQKIKKVCLQHLKQIETDLKRVKEKTHETILERQKKIMFSETSFNEISGGMFAYHDILLKYIDDLDITNLTETINFFHHYQIQLNNISSRIELAKRTSSTQTTLKLETYNKLVEYLRKAIEELSKGTSTSEK